MSFKLRGFRAWPFFRLQGVVERSKTCMIIFPTPGWKDQGFGAQSTKQHARLFWVLVSAIPRHDHERSKWNLSAEHAPQPE